MDFKPYLIDLRCRLSFVSQCLDKPFHVILTYRAKIITQFCTMTLVVKHRKLIGFNDTCFDANSQNDTLYILFK